MEDPLGRGGWGVAIERALAGGRTDGRANGEVAGGAREGK